MHLRELQDRLPWTIRYNRNFRASPVAHKDFQHGLLHVFKAAGKLAAEINEAEHGGSKFHPEKVDPYVADLVICALRMAKTCPGRPFDLEAAVIHRIETKNDISLKDHPKVARKRVARLESSTADAIDIAKSNGWSKEDFMAMVSQTWTDAEEG
jgi:hypothetical protein